MCAANLHKALQHALCLVEKAACQRHVQQRAQAALHRCGKGAHAPQATGQFFPAACGRLAPGLLLLPAQKRLQPAHILQRPFHAQLSGHNVPRAARHRKLAPQHGQLPADGKALQPFQAQNSLSILPCRQRLSGIQQVHAAQLQLRVIAKEHRALCLLGLHLPALGRA